MRDCASRAIFLQKYSSLENPAQQLVRLRFHREWGSELVQGERTDASRTESGEPPPTGRVVCQDAQLSEGGVALVDPAVAVAIEGSQFAKSVSRCRAEQLSAIVRAAAAIALMPQKAPPPVGRLICSAWPSAS